MQLIILGMHRSGTSVLARLLNLMGAYFGPEGMSTGANQENPKGFWERSDVRALNDMVLHSAGCDWNRVAKFDLSQVPADVHSNFRKQAAEILLEMDAHRPWFLKEPRLCLLFPLWRELLELPVCIHIFRNPVEVASSLRARNDMPMEAGLALWERYVGSALHASRGLAEAVVFHGQLMRDPVTVVQGLLDNLQQQQASGLHMPSRKEIELFVRDDLYRERGSSAHLQPYVQAPQVRLFERLEAGTMCFRSDKSQEASDLGTLAAYEAALPPLPLRIDAKKEPFSVEIALRQQTKLVGELMSKLCDIDLPLKQLAQREQALASAMASVEKLDSELKHRDARITQLEQELELASGSASELKEALSRQSSKLDAVKDSERDALRSVADRFREIAKLTQLLIDRELTLEGLVRDVSTGAASLVDARTRVTLVERELSRKAAELEAVQQALDRVHESKVWKLMTAVQAVGTKLMPMRQRDVPSPVAVKLIESSGLFDEAWYLEAYPDVAAGEMSPIEHYLELGAREQRDPGPAFSTGAYLTHYQDVLKAGVNPLLHYIQHGREEGRRSFGRESPGRAATRQKP